MYLGSTLNDLRIVIWIKDDGEYVWYIGYITKVDHVKGKYSVDHLHRCSIKQNKFWQYPSKPDDKQTVFPEQILDVEVKGEWTLEERNNRFMVANEKEIAYEFGLSIKEVV